MMKKLTGLVFLGFAVASLLVCAVLVVSVHAQQMPPAQGGGTGQASGMGGHFGPGPARIPGVIGKVTAIDGATLTVVGGRMNASTTYSVDASNATVLKNGSSSALSDISVGDMVMVQGTITGDSVAATKILDGIGGMMRGSRPSGTPPFFNGSGTRGFASGTFQSSTFPVGWRGYSSSTASSTGTPGQPHQGFFGGIMNFFGGIFGHFRF